jgi:hypothetical protein
MSRTTVVSMVVDPVSAIEARMDLMEAQMERLRKQRDRAWKALRRIEVLAQAAGGMTANGDLQRMLYYAVSAGDTKEFGDVLAGDGV